MPTRLMVWNIQRFGSNKLLTSDFDDTRARAHYIFGSIRRVNPDILVVIEVNTSGHHHSFTELISDGSGGPGARMLLAALRAFDDNWMLVPPLVINDDYFRYDDANPYSEGIAVYFRGNKLDFTGPYKWTGTPDEDGIGAMPADSRMPSAAYAYPWDKALPDTPPASDPFGRKQNRRAGQLQFSAVPAPRGDARKRRREGSDEDLLFPRHGNRHPYLTTFVEKDAHGAPGRTLRLLAVHLPPDQREAIRALDSIARIPEMAGDIANDEVRAIVGDFNIDSLTDDGLEALRDVPGYACHFAARTMLRNVTAGSPEGAPPYYHYTVAMGLDNILSRYGAAAGGALHPEQVNHVVGTARFDPNSMLLRDSIPTIRWRWNSTWARESEFQELENFGRIGGGRGASDHMALFIEL